MLSLHYLCQFFQIFLENLSLMWVCHVGGRRSVSMGECSRLTLSKTVSVCECVCVHVCVCVNVCVRVLLVLL